MLRTGCLEGGAGDRELTTEVGKELAAEAELGREAVHRRGGLGRGGHRLPRGTQLGVELRVGTR